MSLLKKINALVLIGLVFGLLWGLYKVIAGDELFPFVLIDFFLILTTLMYFTIFTARKELSDQKYKILSVSAFIGLCSFTLSYFNPDFLKLSWNFSFGLVFLIIFLSFMGMMHRRRNLIEKSAYYLTLLSCFLIESVLVFKLTTHIIFQITIYVFMITSLTLLMSFVLRTIRKDQ